ncbi:MULTISPECIES: SRPBCC family protein [Kitasatospora]|uniref:SRPBCC family protein n=1 Tax=Kitasatospora cathayae TaxID=3004092 RepID=A0ABY7QAD6_9ACTN|nr:SRPBCC family protein [Kitasatospora sp. HUAS 3-15]WBP89602.1 SRPBCC family protein [Kitasatospora sp. HUAS 3-15]
MTRLREQITVDAPAQEVWGRLHDVEAYSTFLDGVERAYAPSSDRAHLDVRAGGVQREFDAVLTDRGPDQVLAWETQGSPELKGTLSVRSLDRDHSQVQMELEYEPQAIQDTFGGPRGMAQVHRIENTVRGGLEQFKNLVESER